MSEKKICWTLAILCALAGSAAAEESQPANGKGDALFVDQTGVLRRHGPEGPAESGLE